MKKKTIKSILLGIFIFLFIGQIIFSIMQTVEARKAREEAYYYRHMMVDMLDTSKVNNMIVYFNNEIDSLKKEIEIKDSIINSYKNSR